MTLVALFATLLLLAWLAAFLLSCRVELEAERVRQWTSAGRTESAERVGELLHAGVVDGLLLDADGGGVGTLPVRAREEHDPYRTVGELLLRLDDLEASTRPQDREEWVKGVYQLQRSVASPIASARRVLEPYWRAAIGAPWLDERVAAIEYVEPGDRVDPGRMWALSHGTRVRQPLGVVVLGESGAIVSRAKVLCE